MGVSLGIFRSVSCAYHPPPGKIPLNRHDITDTSHTLRPSVLCEVSVIIFWFGNMGRGVVGSGELGLVGGLSQWLRRGTDKKEEGQGEREGDE